MTEEKTPRAEYEARLATRQQAAAVFERRDAQLANLRLLLFLAFVAAVVLAWTGPWPWWSAALPVAGFLALVVIHSRVLDARARAEAGARFYQAGLQRLDGHWAGTGCTGAEYVPDDHLYAGDLDLFGRGGLFEWMCQARTASGEATLARWICEPAPPDVVQARQAAVTELRPLLDLREEIAATGAAVRESVRPEHLVGWALGPPVLRGNGLRVGALVLTVLSIAAGAWFVVTGDYAPLLLIALVDLAVYGSVLGRVMRLAAEADRPCSQLNVLARVVARFEAEEFRSPILRDLKTKLEEGGKGHASDRIRQLDRLVRLFEWQRNQVFLPFAILLLWGIHLGYAIESWRRHWGEAIGEWLAAVGELEALCSLASYAYENPEDVFPEFVDATARFEAQGLGHPLLPARNRITNDVALNDSQRLLVVSGSNMSGKSTLLRTVGINAVLAQAGAPVKAKRLVMSPLEIGATIRVQDSIQQGKSRFYAEIARLEKMMERAEGGISEGTGGNRNGNRSGNRHVDHAETGGPERRPLLFLLDEIMHGTNSHDRRIGSEAILRAFLAKGAIGLITTHDLALTSIADRMNAPARNVHFTDEFRDGHLVFDYQLRDGVVQDSNALELMRSLGLPV